MGQRGAQWKCPRCSRRGVRKARRAGHGIYASWGDNPYLCEHCLKVASPEQLRERAVKERGVLPGGRLLVRKKVGK